MILDHEQPIRALNGRPATSVQHEMDPMPVRSKRGLDASHVRGSKTMDQYPAPAIANPHRHHTKKPNTARTHVSLLGLEMYAAADTAGIAVLNKTNEVFWGVHENVANGNRSGPKSTRPVPAIASGRLVASLVMARNTRPTTARQDAISGRIVLP